LPKHAYQYSDIKTTRVNIDYHLIYDQHLYSVPHHCVGEQVELHAGDKLIEVYFHNNRSTTHVRKYYPGMTTEPGHMPEQHAQHQQWTPGRFCPISGSSCVDIGRAHHVHPFYLLPDVRPQQKFRFFSGTTTSPKMAVFQGCL
jgi:hypothetical protein